MKKLLLTLIVAFAISAVAAQSNEKTETIKVNGECGMCKNRIQTALKLNGISAAVWNVDTKQLTVTYDSAVITSDAIQKKVAAVGHDTEKYAAPDEVYNKLPGCCLYERRKDIKSNSSRNYH